MKGEGQGHLNMKIKNYVPILTITFMTLMYHPSYANILIQPFPENSNKAETTILQVNENDINHNIINVDGLRLHAQPDINSPVLSLLNRNTEYMVKERQDEFVKIETNNGLTGYISKDFCVEEDSIKKICIDENKEDKKENLQPGLQPILASENVSSKIVLTEYQLYGPGMEKNTLLDDADSNPENESFKVYDKVKDTNDSTVREEIVDYAKQFLGRPYVFGGTSLENGTDCSGFTQAIFQKFEKSIGRSSRDQASKGKEIPIEERKLGDLLFYADGDYINHVAIYIGNDKIIHASNPENGITITNYDYRKPYKAVAFFD